MVLQIGHRHSPPFGLCIVTVGEDTSMGKISTEEVRVVQPADIHPVHSLSVTSKRVTIKAMYENEINKRIFTLYESV
jgi:hypothetical protein